MSAIIESLARGATSGISNTVSPSGNAISDQQQRGSDMIRNLAVGGAALGTGTSAVVALMNYLKSMKEENELEDESRMNDDTLYISLPEKSAADQGGVNRWLAPGLALTGGILSAAGSYALTQEVYKHLQKKRRQKMLDEAQGEALLAADMELDKAATDNARMTFYDLATAFPVAVPLLAALAAGGVSYAALNKTFPTVKKPKSKFPKKIRQVSRTGDVTDYAEEDEVLKSAAVAAADQDLEDAGFEYMLLMVDQMAQEKQAKFCLTSELLCKVAKNGLREVEDLQKQAGMEASIQALHGAADDTSLPERVLAAATICKSARIRPVAVAIASAEFQELAPDLYREALNQGHEHMEKFAALAPLFHFAFLRPLMLEKEAAANPLMQELEKLIPNVDPDALDTSLTSDVVGSLAEGVEGGDESEEDLTLTDEGLSGADDDVDLFLQEAEEIAPAIAPVEDEEEDDEVIGE